jgi:hypothetical protein
MTLHCIDCQQPFEFTDSEAKFFTEKGFPNPKRCLNCRKLKKMNSQGKKPWERK